MQKELINIVANNSNMLSDGDEMAPPDLSDYL